MKTSGNQSRPKWFRDRCRKGVFMFLAAIAMLGAMIFVGMSVDLGMITVTKTRMQGAADAAALAAAQEFILAVRTASGDSNSELDLDVVNAAAAVEARAMAEYAVQINGFYIDPETDIALGRRTLASDGSWTETWGTGPYNTVKVSIRKNNSDPAAPDAKLPLIFAPVFGSSSQIITTTATAYIESRDIVCCLDFSSSMNDDSCLQSSTISRLGKPAIEANLDSIWNALVASDVRYSNDSSTRKFPSTGFGLINSATGTTNSSDSSVTAITALGIYTPPTRYYDGWTLITSDPTGQYYATSTTDNWRRYMTGFYSGQLRKQTNKVGAYITVAATSAPGYAPDGPESCLPFPQEGKSVSTGLLLGKPSVSASKTLWLAYADYVRTSGDLFGAGYRKQYGFRTLCQFLMNSRPANYQSEDLWRTPHYPFSALKTGMTTLCNFMTDLGYGDRIGMVDYASAAVLETGLNDDGVSVTVDLGGKYLTSEYSKINTIQLHKQAGHYTGNTSIGHGIGEAMSLLNTQGRASSRKMILLMTDGAPNVAPPSGFSLPSGWDWDALFDYDGDGYADYSTYSTARQYALYEAWLAAQNQVVVHTLCVGSDADVDLMKAIAHLTGGYPLVVSAGTSISGMETELRQSFGAMAGLLPPARAVVSAE